jgi:hypothetical protein
MKLVTKREFDIDSIKIYLHLFKLYKSYLLLISDHEDLGIGSITMATPLYIDGKPKNSKSFKLFGVQNDFLNQIIAEKFSAFFNSPVLLLLFFKMVKNEQEIASSLIKVINQILSDIKAS